MVWLTWQTDFGDRRLVCSRRPPGTKEKQISNYSNQEPWCVTSGCIVWFGFSRSQCCHSANTKQVLPHFSELSRVGFSTIWHCHVWFSSRLKVNPLSEVVLTLCPPLANLMKLQPLTQFSDQRELSCTQMRWGHSILHQNILIKCQCVQFTIPVLLLPTSFSIKSRRLSILGLCKWILQETIAFEMFLMHWRPQVRHFGILNWKTFSCGLDLSNPHADFLPKIMFKIMHKNDKISTQYRKVCCKSEDILQHLVILKHTQIL